LIDWSGLLVFKVKDINESVAGSHCEHIVLTAKRPNVSELNFCFCCWPVSNTFSCVHFYDPRSILFPLWQGTNHRLIAITWQVRNSRREIGNLFMERKTFCVALIVLVDINHTQPATSTQITFRNLQSWVSQESLVNFDGFVVSQVPFVNSIISDSEQFVRVSSESHVIEIIVGQKTACVRIFVI
jgi:hypothetical protein